MKVIVVLPAYNAEKTLERTVASIPAGWTDEIILVDDASKDKTVEVAKKLGLKIFLHKKNRGYGANQKTCYRQALKSGAEIAVMVHPDFQYDPSFIPQMIEPIARGEADAVFGSRMLVPQNALKGGMPRWKFIANIFLTKLENFILGMNLSEYHSGFRAYAKKVLELPIELNSDGFVFDTEIISQMKVAGMKIKEIPISTRYFPEASMIGFYRSLQYGLSILWVMMRYLLGKIKIDKSDRLCGLCGESRARIFLPGNLSLEHSLREKYLITSEKTGHDDIYRCLNCDVGFVPLAGEVFKYYEHSPLDEVYLRDFLGRQKTNQRILNKISSAGKLLDFGCNAGLFLSEAKRFGYDVYGVELSKAAVDYAKENFSIISIASDINEFPDNYFDVITAFDVLEHLSSPADILDKIYSKLKPGGIFVATFPKIDSWSARILKNHWYFLLPSHLFYFSNKSIEYLTEKYNWQLLESRYYRHYFSLSYLLRRFLKNNKLSLPKFFNFILPINTFGEVEIYLKKPHNI